MLGVHEDPLAFGAQVLDGVADHREVLRRAWSCSAISTWRSWLLATSVTTEAPDSRSAATSGSSAAFSPARRVAPNAASVALRSPSSDLGAPEELGVLGIGARPAALDVADAELVEVPRDVQLVLDREVEALLLSAVAQGGVVDVEGGSLVMTGVLGFRMLDGVSVQTKNPPSPDERSARTKGRTR